MSKFAFFIFGLLFCIILLCILGYAKEHNAWWAYVAFGAVTYADISSVVYICLNDVGDVDVKIKYADDGGYYFGEGNLEAMEARKNEIVLYPD